MYGIIYLLTSPSGKHYIGQTTASLNHRWSEHIRDSKRCNYPLSNAICKYGPDSFQKDIIAECPDKVELDRLERFWISLFRSNERCFGYNLRSGGANGKLSEETKLLISEHNGKGMLGKHLSEEAKQKLREANLGKRLSDEHRAKISAAVSGENHPLFGKHHTEEAKNKISLFRQGYTGWHHSDDTKRKMSENNGMKNPETRKKVGAFHKGKIVSSETRKKLSDAAWLRFHFKEIAWG